MAELDNQWYEVEIIQKDHVHKRAMIRKREERK